MVALIIEVKLWPEFMLKAIKVLVLLSPSTLSFSLSSSNSTKSDYKIIVEKESGKGKESHVSAMRSLSPLLHFWLKLKARY